MLLETLVDCRFSGIGIVEHFDLEEDRLFRVFVVPDREILDSHAPLQDVTSDLAADSVGLPVEIAEYVHVEISGMVAQLRSEHVEIAHGDSQRVGSHRTRVIREPVDDDDWRMNVIEVHPPERLQMVAQGAMESLV